MVYHCSFGVCNSDVRYGPKGKRPRQDMDGVTWHTFPPKREMARRQKWVEACGREGYTVDNLIPTSAICSKHFVGGKGPTAEHPDPIPAMFNANDYSRVGRASRLKRPRVSPDIIEVEEPAPQKRQNSSNGKVGRPRKKPNILSKSSAPARPSRDPSLKMVQPSEPVSTVTAAKPPSKRGRPPSTCTNSAKRPSQAAKLLRNVLTGENDHLQTVNSQLKAENRKLRDQITHCKNIITKFKTIREEMEKLGMALPKMPRPHPVTTASSSVASSRGIQGMKVLGDMRVLVSASEEEQSWIKIEPIEDNHEIKSEPNGHSPEGCNKQGEGQSIVNLEGSVHGEVPSVEEEDMYRQAALNCLDESDNMRSNLASGVEEFIIQSQPNGDQVLVCVKSSQDQLIVKQEPDCELMK